MKTIRFTPLDSWFFKEARPMDGFGGSELSSVFPPPVRTLAGAIRTHIGNSCDVDWNEFKKQGSYSKLKDEIGDANSYGSLRFGGVFVEKDGKRLYPAPKHLVQRDGKFAAMHIGNAIECDLGLVRLPELPKSSDNEKRWAPLPDRAWVDEDDFVRILGGGLPQKIYTQNELFADESRVGIGRNNTTRTVEEGKLYQTKHIRLLSDVTVALDIDGLTTSLQNGFCRLGGEGRGAAFETISSKPLPKPIKPKNIQTVGVTFILTTHACISAGSFTEALKKIENRVTIVSACIGKAVREGGFDIANKTSRQTLSYLPAGSVWFCEVKGELSIEEAIKKLHGIQIGTETQLGCGLVACGYWTQNKGDN